MFYIIYICFSGELVATSARNVILHSSLEDKSKDVENGVYGLLVLTNFKLSFLTNDNDQVNAGGTITISINFDFDGPCDNCLTVNLFLSFAIRI